MERRSEIAQVLGIKVDALSNHLRSLNEEERRAVFYKLEHDGPIRLDGTGLKKISEPSPDITLAVPKADDLDKLAEKIVQFGSGAVRQGHAPHEFLVFLREIVEADPKDRISPELRENYATLITQDWVICEIELLSLRGGHNQQRVEIVGWLRRYNRKLWMS
ncbi:MAG TPA: hypothetical protein VGN12_28425 [Pirellulales bacterium]